MADTTMGSRKGASAAMAVTLGAICGAPGRAVAGRVRGVAPPAERRDLTNETSAVTPERWDERVADKATVESTLPRPW